MRDERKSKSELIRELKTLRVQARKCNRIVSRAEQMTKSLRESKSKWRLLFQNSDDALLLTSQGGGILDANEAACRMFGRTVDELRQLGRGAIIDSSDPRLLPLLQDRERAGKARGELTYIRKDGSTFEGEVSSSVFSDSSGNLETAMIIHDVTERKRAEQALKEGEKKFRNLFNNAEEGMFRTRIDGSETVDANEKFLKIFGYTRDEVLGKPSVLLWADERDREAMVRRLKEHGRVVEFECRMLNKLHEVRHCLTSLRFYPKQGMLEGSIIDITERKRAEANLKQALEWQDAIFEGSRDAVFVSNQDSRFVAVNNAACELTGYPRERLLTMRIPDLHDHADLEAYESYHQKIFGGEETLSEAKILRKDGTKVATEFNNRCVWIDGKPYMHTTARDVTERKQAEEALAESERKLRTLFETLPVGVSILNAQRKIVYVNPALERILDISKESLFEGDYGSRTYLRPDATPMPAEEFASVRAIKEQSAVHNVETGVVKEDGTVVWTAVGAVPLGIPDWEVLVVTSDITERKRAEEALRESQEMFQKAFHASQNTMILHTLSEGRHLDVNEYFLRAVGYRREEVIGRTALELGLWWDLAQRDEYLRILRERGSVRDMEVCVRTKSGEACALLLSAEVIEVAGQNCVVLSGLDITERKQAEEELRKSEALLREAQATAHIGHWELDTSIMRPRWSEEIFHIFGLDPEKDEPSFAIHQEITHPDDWHILNNAITTSIGEGTPFDIEFRVLRPDKTIRWMQAIGYPKRDSEGRVKSVFGTAQDITERKRMEEAMRESDIRFRKLASQVPGMIYQFMQKPDGTYCVPFTTEGIRNVFGCSPQDVCDDFSPIAKVILAEDLNIVINSIKESAEQLTPWRCEYRVQIPGQQIRWLYGNSIPEKQSDGSIIWHGFNTDITERKRAEQIIQDERNLLRSIINAIPDEIVVKDLERKFVLANVGCLRALGKQTLDQVMGLRDEDLFSERFARDAREKETDVLTSGETLFNDIAEPRRNPNTGELERVIMSTKTRLHDRSGRPIGLVTVNRNITELHRTQETLRRSEMRFRTVWDSSLDGMRLTDAEGNLVMVNRSFCQLFKKESDELVGRSLADTYLPKLGENIVGDYCERFRNRTITPSLEAKVTIWNGEELCLDLSNTFLSVPDQPELLLSVFRDITGRKRAEEALRESEERFRTLFEQAAVGVALLETKTGQYVRINQKYCDFLGYTIEEMLHKTFQDVTYPDDTQTNMDNNALLIAGTIREFSIEKRYIRKDGTVIWGNLTASPLWTPGTEPHTYFHIAVVEDITERKRAERLTEALYEISNAVYSTDNVNELFRHIHRVLTSMLEANNFFIALLSDDGEALTFPYKVDEKDVGVSPAIKVENSQSLAVEVLRTKRPLLLDETELLDRYAAGRDKAWETAPKSWLGVPLMIRETVIGVMAVQDYHTSGVYSQKDVTLFESAAGQIAVAIERKRTEDALRESEHRTRTFLDSTSDVAFLKDDKFRYILANRALCKFYGRTENEIKRKKDFDLMSEKAALVCRKTDEQTLLSNALTVNEEFIEDRCYETVKFPVEIAEGKVGVGGYIRDVTERKRAEGRLMATQEQLHMLAGHLQNVREDERKHLSQEFHDQLGQVLTALKMDLSMLHRNVADPNKELSRTVIGISVDSMQDMIDRAIGIIREIMSELRPEMLDQLGIIPTLEWEVERFRRQSAISCTFNSEVEEIPLGEKKSIALYRIFQETVTNVARHAKATSVTVSLRRAGTDLVLEVKDNGVGISADAEQKARSFGLIGMRERAILLGGTMEIRGVEGKGTTVLVRIPFAQTLADGGPAL